MNSAAFSRKVRIDHSPYACIRLSGEAISGARKPRYTPQATTARTPEAPSWSAGMNAPYALNSEIVISVLMSLTRFLTSAITQPTASPIAIPPAASAKNSNTVCPAETLAPSAAATATL